MKFSIEREELLRALARVQGIVERRGTLPILANALVEAASDGVTLSATDLEVGVVGRYPAEVAEPGKVTLGGRKLYEIVREFDDSPVEFETDESSRIRVQCGPAQFSLLSISAEEYPTLPSAEGVEFVGLESALLGEMIDRTLYAASTDETRYNLNGIYIGRGEEGRLAFVATDGHRLAKVEKALAEPVPFLEGGIIVPRKGMGEIRKLCEETEGPVEISLEEGFLMARTSGLLLSCRLIDGEFPNYRQVVPKDQRVRLVLDCERLRHGVRRMALVAHERSRGFRLALREGELELSTSNPDLGEAQETLPVEYHGEPFETALNARYMIDALGAVASKEVVLAFLEEVAPVQIQPADDLDQIAVIMPMRL
jgi:DNA polymerase-3 subunit beta